MKNKSIHFKIINKLIINLIILETIFVGVTKATTTNIELPIIEAMIEWTKGSRYILANNREDIKKSHPKWSYLTDKEIKKIDKNNNERVDSNDLVILLRHIQAVRNKNLRDENPNWILYKEAEEIPVTDVSFSETKGKLKVGESRFLIANINPNNATNMKIEWTTSNEQIAKVENGKITGISNGIAIITATSKANQEAKATYEVTVETDVDSIEIDKKNIILDVSNINYRNTESIKIKINPETANINREIELKIKQPDQGIIKIDNSGNIIARKSGTATILATSKNGKQAETQVRVITSPTGISLDKTNIKINLANTNITQLVATVVPENADNELKQVIWESSNEKVVTVSNGKIIAVANGTANITAKTVNGKTATCQVTVEKISNMPKIVGNLNKINSADSCKVVAKSGNIKLREVISNFNKGQTYFQNFAITDDYIYLSKIKQRDEKGKTYGGERVIRINRADNTYEVMRVKNAGHGQGFDVANNYSNGEDLIIMNYFSTTYGHGRGLMATKFSGSYSKLRKDNNTK